MSKSNKIIVFESKKIRRVYHSNEWWFSVVDVVNALTDSADSGAYWRKLKQRLIEEGSQVVTNCHGLKLEAPDGKMRETDCANTQGMLRIIQSIPSPKAEPFKQWLAQVGYERVQEIENPELAQDRMKEIYEQKGYPRDWIDKRLRGIAIRQNLTDEWKERGIDSATDFAILTAEISKATFGITPTEYKNFKGLSKKNEKPENFKKSQKVAKRGGKVAGKARKVTEKELGRSVISRQNYLSIEYKRKKKK
jgi:prophage antirepressor-like protein